VRRFLASRTPPLPNPPLLLFTLPVTLLYLAPRYIQGSREEVKEVTFDADATQVTTPLFARLEGRLAERTGGWSVRIERERYREQLQQGERGGDRGGRGHRCVRLACIDERLPKRDLCILFSCIDERPCPRRLLCSTAPRRPTSTCATTRAAAPRRSSLWRCRSCPDVRWAIARALLQTSPPSGAPAPTHTVHLDAGKC